MLLTEKEAREKWCPEARAPGRLIGRDTPDEPDRTLSVGSQNRGYQMGLALNNCRCLASDCMFWRWWDAIKDGKAYYVECFNNPAPSCLDGPLETRRGYCGKAGKP